MQTIYEGSTYYEKNPTWHEEDSPWKASHIASILEDNQISPDQICEVGCGVGEILVKLAERFPKTELTGYEISPNAYSKAKDKETDQVKFYLSDIVEHGSTQSDVVLAIDVIEHVDDYLSFLKKLRSLGTYKILHIPLDLSVQSVLRSSPIMRQRSGVGHIHYFYKDLALAALKDCGYAIIDYRYTASRLELPNQALSSNLMRWPRRLLYALSPDLAVRIVGGYSLLVLAK